MHVSGLETAAARLAIQSPGKCDGVSTGTLKVEILYMYSHHQFYRIQQFHVIPVLSLSSYLCLFCLCLQLCAAATVPTLSTGTSRLNTSSKPFGTSRLAPHLLTLCAFINVIYLLTYCTANHLAVYISYMQSGRCLVYYSTHVL